MRIALMYLRLFFQVPWVIFRLWLYGLSKDKFVHFHDAFMFIKKWTIRANRAGRVTVVAEGVRNLPPDDGYIMYSNHEGLFDTLIFFQTCPRPFSIMAKKEVKNVILLKQILAAIGGYPIDRKDVRQAMGVINSIASDVRRGKNFLIFPEGTRCRTPNVMGEFKSGSFKSATKANCPIVPCALIDAHLPFDDIRSVKPVTVRLRFLPPIYPEEYQGMKTVEIAAIVKERIAAAMSEMQMQMQMQKQENI